MEFKLNEYHRNVSDEQLLDDVKKVADIYNKPSLTIEMYKKYGKYNITTITRRFGSWKKVLKMIGLKYIHGPTKNENNIEVTEEQLLEDLRNTALQLGVSTLTSTQYDEHGKHGRHIVFKRFKKWESALIKAGLEPSGFHSSVTSQELIEEIERIWIQLGRQPTSTDIKNGVSKFSLNSYARKFGSWRKAIELFVEYINSDNQQEKKDETSDSFEKTMPSPQLISTTRKTKRDINLRLRFLVMKRDSFKCCMCGRSPATTPNLILHIDHIVPWSKGGETVMENLQTLCQDCNLGKRNLE